MNPADSPKTLVSQSSSFKHNCTKTRSLKKADNALPRSPNKKKETISSLASKYQLRIAQIHKKRSGPKCKGLTEEQIQWLVTALDRLDIAYMNPGKNENVYIGKLDGVKQNMNRRDILYGLLEISSIF